MKVLYIITLPDLGGAQTHLYEILKYARRYGIEPVLALGQRGWLSEQAEKNIYRNPSYKKLNQRNLSYQGWQDLVANVKQAGGRS